MGAAILIGALAVTGWLGSLYVHPFGRCSRCRGRRVTGGSKRTRLCRSCGGSGRQQRRGSRTVHRTARLVRAERARNPKEPSS